MTSRAYNFSAGPCALPLPVLEQVSKEMQCIPGQGVSILEIGHRTSFFQDVVQQATTRLRKILRIPDDYDVFFLQGGGRLMFSLLPMNFAADKAIVSDFKVPEYIVTGSWGHKALEEAEQTRRWDDSGIQANAARCLWSGHAGNYSSIPSAVEFTASPDSAYVHYTTNETIQGVQFPSDLRPFIPEGIPLIADMSSDILSRRINVSNYDLIYACVQKNLGPAGATLVIAKQSFLARSGDRLPGYCNLQNHAQSKSMYNTPPVFSIYVVNLVLQWFENTFGELDQVEQFSKEKSNAVYNAVLDHPECYRLHASEGCRSMMNVTFALPDAAREKTFLEQAEKEGLLALGGHRSVGGVRASLYNAITLEAAHQLASFIRKFAVAENRIAF